jgi:prophage maintenance system killer protein
VKSGTKQSSANKPERTTRRRRGAARGRIQRGVVRPRAIKGQQTRAATGEVVLYQPRGGKVQLDVRLERDSVWLTQQQMSGLFHRERSVITKHLRNVFTEGELERSAVCANFAHTAPDGKTYQVEHYNLDVVISVGYRVKSKQGTQFRIWATQTLRDHLLRGYTLNEKRLRERGLDEAEQAIDLLSNTLRNQSLVTEQGSAVLDVVQRYTRAWRLLLEYDEDRLATSPAHPIAPTGELTLEDAHTAISDLRASLVRRNESSDLFGREHSAQLHGILGAIAQTFDGEPLYPTAQARAAHLLYFVIKDHPFADGNKRIGTLLFLEYLRRNGLLLRNDRQPRLAANAMVALALLVAESNPTQKELMIRLVLNLLENDS